MRLSVDSSSLVPYFSIATLAAERKEVKNPVGNIDILGSSHLFCLFVEIFCRKRCVLVQVVTARNKIDRIRPLSLEVGVGILCSTVRKSVVDVGWISSSSLANKFRKEEQK